MIPILLKIGPLEIPSYGLCLATGILLGWIYFNRQFRTDPNREIISSLITYSVLAGFLGARVNYILEHTSDIASFADFFGMFFSRSGLTVYGGILAGIGFGYYYSRRHGLPTIQIMDAGAPGICIGYFFGRLGCHLSGDGDYGIPSNLPWAMGYPNGTVPTPPGVRVHPAPIYEMILYALIFAILVHLKRKQPAPGRIFALFLILAGIERFFIEFIRLNRPLLLGLTEAQIVSVVLVFLGVWFLASPPAPARVAA